MFACSEPTSWNFYKKRDAAGLQGIEVNVLEKTLALEVLPQQIVGRLAEERAQDVVP